MQMRIAPPAWCLLLLALVLPAVAGAASSARAGASHPRTAEPEPAALDRDAWARRGWIPLSATGDGLVRRLWAPPRRRATPLSARDAAQAFLRSNDRALFGRPVAVDADGAVQLRAARRRESLTGRHSWWRQLVHGVPVEGGWVAVHQDLRGRVMEVESRFEPGLLDLDSTPSIPAETARLRARAAVDAEGPPRAPVAVELVIDPRRRKLVWKVTQPLWAPYGDWCTWVDAHDGTVLGTDNLMADGKELAAAPRILDPPVVRAAPSPVSPSSLVTGSGLVFPSNPLNGHPERYTLRDGDPMDGFRQNKTLFRLDGSGWLRGAWVDARTDFFSQAKEPTLVFDYSADSTGSAFHAVNAYWHIDTFQDYLQTTLGITSANNRQTVIYAHALSADNSMYSPLTKDIRFGDGGVDDAEDGEIIIHEYGHAIHDDIIPNYTNSGETGAISEGFGDYLAATFGGNSLVGEWDATAYNPGPPPFLRRTDGSKIYPQDIDFEIHDDGEIISAVWWRLHGELGQQLTDRLVIESFFHIGPDATFVDFADAMLLVDQELYSSTHAPAIYAAYQDRGIQPNYDLLILHTPLSSTEDLVGPYRVEARIAHGKPLAATNPVQLYWRWNPADPWTIVPMVDEGASLWSGSIPGPGQDTRIEYAITAIDSIGVRVWSPVGAPLKVHTFRVAADNLPPTLVHVPLGDSPLQDWPAVVVAQATDPSGIAQAFVSWSLNGSYIGTFVLDPQGGDLYAAPFPYPAQLLKVGDTIEYVVTATDASQNGNAAQSGPHTFTLTERPPRVLVLADDLSMSTFDRGKWGPDKKPRQSVGNDGGVTARTRPSGPAFSGAGAGVAAALQDADSLAADLRRAGFLVDEESAAASDPAAWDTYDLLVLSFGGNTSPAADPVFRQAVRAWVKQGGKLLVEGGEVGYDATVAPRDPDFAAEVLHARRWVGDQSGSLSLTVAGEAHPLRTDPNLLPAALSRIDSGNYGDQDTMVPTADATVIYGTQEDPAAGGIIVYDDDTHPTSAQIVIWCFRYSTLADRGEAAALAENTARYLTAVQPVPTASLSGVVTLENSGPAAGARVWATPSRVGAVTAADGSYQLTGLYPGNYTVWVEGPAGWETTSGPATLVDNQHLGGLDFTLRPLTTIDLAQAADLAIPDNDPVGIRSTIRVPPSGEVSRVQVDVQIEHPWRSDLLVTLTSPSGTMVTLHNRSGGDQNDLVTSYPDSTAVDGPGSLPDFAGELAEGDWVLAVEDLALGDAGRLVGWGLHLSTVARSGVGLAVSDLSATATGEGVVLSWIASREQAEYLVRRSVDDAPWETRTPRSLPSDGERVRFVDGYDGVKSGSRVRYQIDLREGSGVAAALGEVALRVAEIPGRRFELLPNRPNPFNPATVITFRLPRQERVSLRIYDLTGRRVATLVDEVLPAGEHQVRWNGRDSAGRAVASGTYFYRLRTARDHSTRSMVLLK